MNRHYSKLAMADLRHEVGLRATDVVPHPLVPDEEVLVFAGPPVIGAGVGGRVERQDYPDAQPLPTETQDGRAINAPCPACGTHIVRAVAYFWTPDPYRSGIYSVTAPATAVCFEIAPCGHVVSGWGYQIDQRPPEG